MRGGMWLAAIALLVVGVLGLGRAELKTEDRKDATDVFSGKVVGVYKQEGKISDDYVVEIAVEKVEKGKTASAGATGYASCFKRRPGVNKPSAAGHNLIPNVGQRVRMYTKRENGKNSGVYPDWADVLK